MLAQLGRNRRYFSTGCAMAKRFSRWHVRGLVDDGVDFAATKVLGTSADIRDRVVSWLSSVGS